MNNNFSMEFDVVVIGSGVGGMASALRAHDLGAKVVIIEKSQYYGGSSALSGGTLWIPNNHLMAGVHIADTDETALQYLKSITKGKTSDEKLQTYIRKGAEVIKYLEEKSEVKFKALPQYSDYYPNTPGSVVGARSIEAKPYSGKKLKNEWKYLKAPHPQELVFGKISLTGYEAQKLISNTLFAKILMFKHILRYYLSIHDRIRFKRDSRLALGNALIGRFRKSLIDRNIPILLNTELIDLIAENEKIIGIHAKNTNSEEETTIKANKGVILASGGFERNKPMREQFQRKPISDIWTAANEFNIGTSIQLGIKYGAKTDLLDDAWWTPTFLVPNKSNAYVVIVEKSLPGCVLVDKEGKRFVDEAAPYIDVVNAMYENNKKTTTIPAYFIIDRNFRKKYPCGPLLPTIIQPDFLIPKDLKSWFHKDKTLKGLAEKLGINVANLDQTIKKVNEYAKTGTDPEFGKGSNRYDVYYGDKTNKPNPCLGQIKKSPFYGFEVWPGDLGTKGGLVTNVNSQVLNKDNQPIKGLYATGNCSASIMANTYAGAGATLGPAVVFGFIASEHIMKS